MNNFTNAALLLLRLSVGGIMIFAHGLGKLVNPSPFVGHLASNGFPFPSVLGYLSISSETVFPLLIVLGLFTRLSAAIAAVNMFVAAFIYHLIISGDSFQKWETPVLYFIVFVFIVLVGPGDWSLKKMFVGES